MVRSPLQLLDPILIKQKRLVIYHHSSDMSIADQLIKLIGEILYQENSPKHLPPLLGSLLIRSGCKPKKDLVQFEFPHKVVLEER